MKKRAEFRWTRTHVGMTNLENCYVRCATVNREFESDDEGKRAKRRIDEWSKGKKDDDVEFWKNVRIDNEMCDGCRSQDANASDSDISEKNVNG